MIDPIRRIQIFTGIIFDQDYGIVVQVLSVLSVGVEEHSTASKL